MTEIFINVIVLGRSSTARHAGCLEFLGLSLVLKIDSDCKSLSPALYLLCKNHCRKTRKTRFIERQEKTYFCRITWFVCGFNGISIFVNKSAYLYTIMRRAVHSTVPQTTRQFNGRYQRFDDKMGINSLENELDDNEKGEKLGNYKLVIDILCKMAALCANKSRISRHFFRSTA